MLLFSLLALAALVGLLIHFAKLDRGEYWFVGYILLVAGFVFAFVKWIAPRLYNSPPQDWM